MDIMEKLIGLVLGAVAFVYLITSGFAPAVASANFTIGGTDYAWVLGLITLIIVFVGVELIYKHSKGSKK